MPPATTVVSKVYTKEELCLMEQLPQPCGIVIFGASGDLAHRKLFPSLFKLFTDKVLPKSCYVIGIGRTKMTDEQFQDTVRKSLRDPVGQNGSKAVIDEKTLQEFVVLFSYQAGDYGDGAFYGKLSKELERLDKLSQISCRHIYYLSTPPSLYETIIGCLAQAGLAKPADKATGCCRIVLEKPYGHDLVSAQHLTAALHQAFNEDQIYRIDHYLGKETVQNILMLRFANAIYEPIWNQKYIDHIQITAAEAEGVGHRAGYYEQAGVIRDMFQNHLFQLLSLVAMEPPASMEGEDMRDEKSQVVKALKPFGLMDIASCTVRGQYQGYRQEESVKPNSSIETFAALKIEIDNWRWKGVPFYLRSGKKMAKRVTEINIQFKTVPASIFKPLMADQLSPNILDFRIQPDEGISMRFEAKHPGPKLCMSSVTMEFNYQEAFGTPPPEAYARLFLDVMLGDQTLFARRDWENSSWGFLDPLLDHWAEQGEKGLASYVPGSMGPAEADALLTRDGREWLTK